MNLGYIVHYAGWTFPFAVNADDWPVMQHPITQAWVMNDDLHRFTGHRPGRVEPLAPPAPELDSQGNPIVFNGPSWFGYYYFQNFELLDELDNPMPQVWIQERFTFETSLFHWGTGSLEVPGRIYRNGDNVGFMTNMSQATHWTSVLDPQNSSMRGLWGPDLLRIAVPVSQPSGGGNPPWYDFQHHYYAATRSSSLPYPTTQPLVGVFLGTFTLQMWTNPPPVHSSGGN